MAKLNKYEQAVKNLMTLHKVKKAFTNDDVKFLASELYPLAVKYGNPYVDENGKPYDENESWPAGGGLHKDCEFNKEALEAFDKNVDDLHDFLIQKGWKNVSDGCYRKGNTEVTYDDEIDGMYGYVHTELIKNKK